MTATQETIVVRGERISVDLLVWRRYRTRADGMVEAVLAANPGLAALGPYLPVGTLVMMPVIDLSTPTAAIADAVRLWS